MATIILSAESERQTHTASIVLADFQECTMSLIQAVAATYDPAMGAEVLLKWLVHDGTTGFQFEHTCACGNCATKLIVSYLP